MADFCFQCTRDVLGHPPEENDYKGLTEPGWHLCEGCGVHILNPGGVRIHEVATGDPLHLDDDCPTCVRLATQGQPTDEPEPTPPPVPEPEPVEADRVPLPAQAFERVEEHGTGRSADDDTVHIGTVEVAPANDTGWDTDGWQGGCTCGWLTGWMATEAEADEATAHHVAFPNG